MEYKRCPNCGSTYFVINHNGYKYIFHVDDKDQLVDAREQESSVNLFIDAENYLLRCLQLGGAVKRACTSVVMKFWLEKR